MPKQPPKKRCRCPSRSTYCAARNRTSACAAVNLMVAMRPLYDAWEAMSKLVVHSHDPDSDGCIVRVTTETAGWRYVGFEVLRIGSVERREEGRETCIVVLAGNATFAAGGRVWADVGRAGVFDGPPVALYVPPGEEWHATGDAELAICTAPASRGAELRLLDTPRHESRGIGSEG